MDKHYKLTYEIQYTGDNEPSSYTVEFIYFETLIEFIKNTAMHQYLLSFTVEKLY